MQIFFSMIFLSVTYFMTGLPLEIDRFLLFSLIGILTSLTAEGMGFFIGSVFNVTVSKVFFFLSNRDKQKKHIYNQHFNFQNGSAVAPLTLAPFLGLATYGFDFAKSIPWYIAILMKMSFLRSGTVGIVITIFGRNRKKLDCYQNYCHFADPKVLLEYLDIDHTTVWSQIYYLMTILIIFRAAMYIALRYKLTM